MDREKWLKCEIVPDEMREKMQNYLNIMEVLNKTTDDYLFLADIKTGITYFCGNIDEKYDVERLADGGVSREAWEKIIYFRDLNVQGMDFSGLKSGDRSELTQEYRLVDRNGNKVWVNSKGSVMKDSNGTPCFLIGRLSETLMSPYVDQLTGLLNNNQYMKDMKETLSTGKKGYFVVFGIDNFKNINMKYGRGFGNHVLRKTAEGMEKILGTVQGLYRLDSDKFAMNLEGYSAKEVLLLYKKVQEEVERYCTVSAGAVAYGEMIRSDVNSLYQYAEAAMDRVKKDGKNNLNFFSKNAYVDRLSVIHLQDELAESVRRGMQGFYLCYQPKVSCQTCEIHSMEALLRFRTSQGKLLSPVDFIPVLESSGLICPVGEWVLRTALEQCRKWRQKLPDLKVCVNLSYVQLSRPEISRQVLEAVRDSGIPGNALILEITESMQLQDYAAFNKIFRYWSKEGIQISIDDFGTGYSSLSYLKSLEVDEIKIDQCFVRDIHGNAYNQGLLRNIIELAHSAQISVCCEGVETEQELMVVQSLKADVLQGYLFAKPLEAETFEETYLCKESWEYRERIDRENRLRFKTEEKEERLHELLYYQYGDILDRTEMGLWIIRFDEKMEHCRLYADSTMLRVMGVTEKLTPEECYQFWYSRIDDGYYDYVNNAVKQMTETERIIQVEYTWHHPVKGEVIVRCVGVRMENKGNMISLQGYHRNINDIYRPRPIGYVQSDVLFEYNEKRHSAFFHNGQEFLYQESEKEADFPEGFIKRGMVHPDFIDAFRSMFSGVDSQDDVVQKDIMLKGSGGTYQKFQVQTRHLGKKKSDEDTILVMMNLSEK